MHPTIDTFFNPSRPLFVKVPFQSGGKFWERGERYNWEFFHAPVEMVKILFQQDFVGHNPELEEEVAKKIVIGDGLEELTIEQLHVLVNNINAKVKAKTENNAEFISKRCLTSKVKDKQIGLIRRWRLSYGELE